MNNLYASLIIGFNYMARSAGEGNEVSRSGHRGPCKCKVSSLYVVFIWRRINDKVACCRFLTMLEEEVYGANSPIWDVEFTQNHASASNGAGEWCQFFC